MKQLTAQDSKQFQLILPRWIHDIYIYLIIISTIFFFLQRKGILQILKITAKHQGFIYLFIHSFIYTLFHLIIHLLILLLIHLFIHLLIHLLIHLPIHAFIHSFLCIHNSLCFSLAMHFCTHNNNTQRKPPPKVRRDIREQIWYYFKWK